jgi:hypothetical protein
MTGFEVLDVFFLDRMNRIEGMEFTNCGEQSMRQIWIFALLLTWSHH